MLQAVWRKQRMVEVIAMACTLVVAGCREQPELEVTFVAELVGDQSVGEPYEIVAKGLSSRRDSRQYTASAVPAAFGAAEFPISSWLSGTLLSTVILRPFVCAEETSFAERRAQGWTAEEKHQVLLPANGLLEVGSNFEHSLVYSCRMQKPGTSMGTETSTFMSAPPLCADADRSGTRVSMRGRLWGEQLEYAPKTCSATLSEIDAPPTLLLTFTALPDGGFLQFDLELTRITADDSLPRTVAVPSIDTKTSFFAVRGKEKPETLDVASGTWTIESVSFRNSGRITGAFAIDCSGPAGSVSISGTVDLPLLQLGMQASGTSGTP